MRTKIFIFLVLFVGALFGGEQKLTLQECIELAKINSKKLEVGRAQVMAAESGKNEARSLLLPHISADGKYEKKNTARDFSVFSDYGGSFSTETVGVMANLLLFDFFSSYNQLKAGRSLINASEISLKRTMQYVEEEAKIDYFRVLETKKNIRVVEDAIGSLERQLLTAKDFYKQGIVAKNDLLSVEVQLAEKKKLLLRAKNEYTFAVMTLNKLIGKEMTAEILLEEVAEEILGDVSFENMQKQALNNRLDLKALKKQIESLELRYRAAFSAYAPKFFAFGGYNYMCNSTSDKNNWVSGGIGMQVSLYDGGKNQSQIQKIRAQLKEARANLDDLEKGILLEVNNVILQLQEQKETILIDRKALELAVENHKVILDRYKQGLLSINDVLKAEEQLSSANMNQNRSLYRYLAIYARLINVIGGEIAQK